MSKKILRAALRDQLIASSPRFSVKRSEIGQAPGRDMIRLGLADLVEGEDGVSYLSFTDLGLAVREILVELKATAEERERMKESILSGIAYRTSQSARKGGEEEALARLPASTQSRGPSCGTLNHDSFQEFITSLNAAGLNSWGGSADLRRNVDAA